MTGVLDCLKSLTLILILILTLTNLITLFTNSYNSHRSDAETDLNLSSIAVSTEDNGQVVRVKKRKEKNISELKEKVINKDKKSKIKNKSDEKIKKNDLKNEKNFDQVSLFSIFLRKISNIKY